MTTEERLSETLRAVLRITGEDQAGLAQVIGNTRLGVNRRINGRGKWTFAELDMMALHWGISPLHLLMGPEEAMKEILRVHGGKMIRQPTGSAA